MAFDQADIVTTLRAMLLSVGTTEVSDTKLHESIEQAKRRLDRDRPRLRTDQLAGDGGDYYDVSGLSGWVRGSSTVRNIQNPEPIVADDDPFRWNDHKSFTVQDINGTEQLIIFGGADASLNVLVEYTVPWIIKDVESGAATDVEKRYENAVEFMAMSLVCSTLAAKAASTLDSNIPGDLISWRTKEAEYRRTAQSYEERYQAELGLDTNVVPAIILRGDYDRDHQSGQRYVTHYRSRR